MRRTAWGFAFLIAASASSKAVADEASRPGECWCMCNPLGQEYNRHGCNEAEKAAWEAADIDAVCTRPCPPTKELCIVEGSCIDCKAKPELCISLCKEHRGFCAKQREKEEGQKKPDQQGAKKPEFKPTPSQFDQGGAFDYYRQARPQPAAPQGQTAQVPAASQPLLSGDEVARLIKQQQVAKDEFAKLRPELQDFQKKLNGAQTVVDSTKKDLPASEQDAPSVQRPRDLASDLKRMMHEPPPAPAKGGHPAD